MACLVFRVTQKRIPAELERLLMSKIPKFGLAVRSVCFQGRSVEMEIKMKITTHLILTNIVPNPTTQSQHSFSQTPSNSTQIQYVLKTVFLYTLQKCVIRGCYIHLLNLTHIPQCEVCCCVVLGC